jgi:hypothetical protein
MLPIDVARATCENELESVEAHVKAHPEELQGRARGRRG